MEKLSTTVASNRLIENKLILPSTSLVEPELVERILETNQDIIDPQWSRRHGKLISLKGVVFYEQLAFKARKYGKNPRALMASLVNKELQA